MSWIEWKMAMDDSVEGENKIAQILCISFVAAATTTTKCLIPDKHKRRFQQLYKNTLTRRAWKLLMYMCEDKFCVLCAHTMFECVCVPATPTKWSIILNTKRIKGTYSFPVYFFRSPYFHEILKCNVCHYSHWNLHNKRTLQHLGWSIAWIEEYHINNNNKKGQPIDKNWGKCEVEWKKVACLWFAYVFWCHYCMFAWEWKNAFFLSFHETESRIPSNLSELGKKVREHWHNDKNARGNAIFIERR